MARRFQIYAGESTVKEGGRNATTHRFRPEGSIYERHEASEDIERIGSGGYAARLFVGLNVGARQAFTIEDLIERVVRIRKRQGASPDMSVLAQRGIYEDRSHQVINEPSAQIIMIDLGGRGKREFVSEMQDLAGELLGELEQETIILEIQKRGVVQDVFIVS